MVDNWRYEWLKIYPKYNKKLYIFSVYTTI